MQKQNMLIAYAAGFLLALEASAQTVDSTISRAPGSYTRDTTVTRANGKTATYQDNRTWGNGVYSNTKSYTGVNGHTRTDTVTRSGGEVTNTFTGRNGVTRTYSHPAHYRR